MKNKVGGERQGLKREGQFNNFLPLKRGEGTELGIYGSQHTWIESALQSHCYWFKSCLTLDFLFFIHRHDFLGCSIK